MLTDLEEPSRLWAATRLGKAVLGCRRKLAGNLPACVSLWIPLSGPAPVPSGLTSMVDDEIEV